MKPGERIQLLKTLAARMAELPADELSLTLRQFEFPSRPWYGEESSYDYTLRMIEDSGETALLALHDYLYPADTSTDATSAGSWEAASFRLFMSHISAKKAAVAAVKHSLARFSIDGFVAHEDIEPTKEWVHEIETALGTCHALAAFLTPGFHESNWTDQEIGFCVRRRVLVIPVRVGVDPYGFIAGFQALTPPTGYTAETLAEQLFGIVVNHPLTAAHMSDALVTRFENSASFAAAKRNVELLQRVSLWTPSLLNRMTAACEHNFENQNAFGVPQKIAAIVGAAATGTTGKT